MALTLTLPEPGGNKRVKDIVIDILAFEWPLTLSQIYNRLTKNHNQKTTCQATYKALCELTSGGVLSKQDRLYSISSQWIDRIKEFASHIEKNYNSSERVPLIDGILKTKTENNVTVLTFNSTLDMDKTWMNIKKEYYKNLNIENDITFWEGSHCWWLLTYPESEYAELEKIKEKKVKHYFVNHGNTELDKYAKKFYSNSNVPFKIKNEPAECDIGVFGDTIMQVYLPLEIRTKIEEIYKKAKNPLEVNIPDFIKNVLNKKTPISLVLTKNPEIAQHLKQKIATEFNHLV
jgi:hypothetical protein